MKKFIEYKKRSKKEQQKTNNAKRVLWSSFGVQSPISRIIESKKKERDKYCCRGKSSYEY